MMTLFLAEFSELIEDDTPEMRTSPVGYSTAGRFVACEIDRIFDVEFAFSSPGYRVQ